MQVLLLILSIYLLHCTGWENTFLELGETIAKSFNLSNCWVCGGPGDLNEWPWVAQPVQPKWWVSNLSMVRNGTELWAQDSSPWRLYSSGMGILCLNRTKPKGVYVGESQCEWTLSPGFDCWDPNCLPYNCSKYQGRWNQTHVQLTNGSWIACSYQLYDSDDFASSSSCNTIQQDKFFDNYLFLSCQRDNTTAKNHVIRLYRWAWQHYNGTRTTHFRQFWSSTTQPKGGGCNCVWKMGAGAWKCEHCNSKGESVLGGGPLGPGDHLYFEMPKYKTNNWSLSPNTTTPDPWDGPFANGTWALKGHYWICGQYAYRRLPPNWSGVCYVGYIRPLFFLLPLLQGKTLGVKVYDDLIREQRSIDSTLTAGSSQKWGTQEWPPERIIEHYGPATWNPNELVTGAREPIYNLNRIIRLQAVLEIVTNQTATALDLLADQATQMRTAIYQHHIALDYLLAEEGGLCAKLNESNCCLQIDDNGKAVKRLTKEMRKLTHVPVQTWKGWDTNWLTSWLPHKEWIRQSFLFVICIIMALLALACLTPCLVTMIRRLINQTINQRVMVLFQPVKAEDWGY
ncbi:uncharacterized protein LOC120399180 [Mauremys reevesii]|uniref:uncharacterized protein LOC120399180 n=1 Tax=Mauremys reevesii TaxID=260615 RepID=UPI00193F60BD|nr:uncharacterized protein LOC120399180 [Mauremys reevesii]